MSSKKRRYPKSSNRLVKEKSPYLLQHAYNPVDWYPWSDEAFIRAKREQKPIFLSIGYSTCHWCHVMERESFEDQEVAKLMNDAFISIKVDREERPDIDKTYMTVAQMLTGRGGWPLTIIMTPEKKPFFAATYIPKNSRYGMTGMLDLIPQITKLWQTQKNRLADSAERISQQLKQYVARSTEKVEPEALGIDALHFAYEELKKSYEPMYGGFSYAPKFPSPHKLTFLLRYWKRTKKENALDMAEKTLSQMRLGGIFDHVGYGFHRYSTDNKWLLPHFEKMLYDQAMLIIAYSRAYQATKKKEYRKTAQEIITYVLRDMTSPEGGFYSAEDADSEGEEGKFYLWTQEEINRILTKTEAKLAIKIFNIEKRGNFVEETSRSKTGRNILYLDSPLSELAKKMKTSGVKLQTQLAQIIKKLYNHRKSRIPPLKDDKILVDWNGLMIAALSLAGQIFNEKSYVNAAKKAANFILGNMINSTGKLYHRYRDGEPAILGFLDDYSFFIWGLIELYEATFNIEYLKQAITFTNLLLNHFWDRNGGFFLTADFTDDVLVRQNDPYDGAIPSGNSIAMLNLIRLGRLLGNHSLEEKGLQLGQTFTENILQVPSAHTQLISAIDFAIGPSYEVVIVGNPKNEDTKKMIETLRMKYIPNKVVLLKPDNVEDPEINKLAAYLQTYVSRKGKATVYVCKNQTCELPTTDTKKMLQSLR